MHGRRDFASRVIRDKSHRVRVDEKRQITRLHDLKKDPREETHLADSDEEAHVTALKKFQAMVASQAEGDACPRYTPRAANPWDLKPKTQMK